MYIQGLHPRGEQGRSFETDRATWRALLFVLHEAGAPVPAEHAESFRGVPDRAQADALAGRLENYLDTHADNLFVRVTDEERHSPSGSFIGMPGPGEPRERPPSVHRDQVHAFAGFLRHSGGFHVAADS